MSGDVRPAAELLREVHRQSHPDCRWIGPHFVPPSMGEPGFFLCERGMLEPPTMPESAPPMSRARDVMVVGEVMADLAGGYVDMVQGDLRRWSSDELKHLRSIAHTLSQICSDVLAERFAP